MSLPNVLAKALYDNAAESPDELSFRKGDILTVLERDTQGLDGWWLCSLHGRQGIVPGNRLKVLVGMYDKHQEHGSPSMIVPASSCPTSQMQPSPHTQSECTRPSSTQYTGIPSIYSTPNPAQPKSDSVYMIPPLNVPKPNPQILYHVPSCPSGPPLNVKSELTIRAPALAQSQWESSGQDVYQVPPSLSLGLNHKNPQAASFVGKDVYQVPSSLEKSTWEESKTLSKGVAVTHVGPVCAYDTIKKDHDKCDGPPRHQLLTQQDIYDVPPTREKYNTQVYDFPPTVSKDVPGTHLRKEETYDVPSHLTKKKPQASTPSDQCMLSSLNEDCKQNPLPEDVYDVPPPTLTQKLGQRDKLSLSDQDIYNFPASVHHGGPPTMGVYDIPRELEERGGSECTNIYDVPPQVVRDAQFPSEELQWAFKRLSASSTGSTLSNNSASCLDVLPVTDNDFFSHSPAASLFTGKPLLLDLDAAMERLARLQQAVELSVSVMMSFITNNWRSPDNLVGNLPAICQAGDRVCVTLRDFLEFSRGAVANAGQATDHSLQTKLGRQVGKMEEVFQSLIKQTQSLDAISRLHTELAKLQPGDVLDQLIMTVRGIPDDTKQLSSFLHGNGSLLFKRSPQQQLPLPPLPGRISCHVTGPEGGSYHAGERINIQSRPLPSPPKFAAAEEEGADDRPYETTEEGWMEDYDYVHLQGKEEFEKSQRQLMEKGSINKTQLEQQQIKQFERLEQEVSRPINNDLTGWVPSLIQSQANQSTQNGSSKLCHADRQLLLFYLEQSVQNFTTVNNAIDAFFTAINSNQLPKVFVAHSKLIILSAHKLVFIGDTLSRQAKSPEVRVEVGRSSNTLCNKLKDIVISTKTAALQYPSPGAAREMSEKVRELAGCTQQFKIVLGQLLML
ncbi:breast cancer anti-estrogen resistance protein 1 isoform X2 [Syngnathoides biaculeatus]|uniref:breast cancer anti-estrogen resistance protein 1 isoform X2 n=1 Tax=Syngnathoides biaculeatus TaxID=300417 RepID=UPI002ADDD12A|nr:breast cancer anti-estrogen resistance protein 1 isoform X2 [Syngnathoides biaculeatus]XP_061679841.1 breast cancer anti-estrogen resistance protein 1 isoform X2 [Syngnathoides biaculeatus]XP_061679842.1 breast cancer anti-estrogen resistance protein 1 isoform X2 [Syngnathoides biaculeatus]